MILAKQKRVHLTGKKARKLYEQVYERDGGHCIVCGAYIPFGVKEHHEPCGAYKSDEPEKTVMLCNDCHYKRHNDGSEGPSVRAACISYLQDLYGERGAKRE